MDADAFNSIMIEAIAREVASRDFYRAAAKKVRDASARAVLEGLAADEEEHRSRLEEFRFDPGAVVEFEKVPEDAKVAEAEETVSLSFDMKPKDVFQVAMKKEQAAMEAYQDLAARCTVGEFRKLFEELAAMEQAHKTRLENLFVNAAYPEDWGE